MELITIDITLSEKTRLLSYCESVHDSGPLTRFFSKFTGRGDEAPAIDREFGISLDERIRRAKTAAKRINKIR